MRLNNGLLLLGSCLGLGLLDIAGAQGFTDNFEAPVLAPFWTQYVNHGQVTFPSTAQVHAGSQALQLNTVGSLPGNPNNKSALVRHVFPQPTYGHVSVWMYDTGATAISSNYITLWAPPFGIGTWDYNLSPSNGGTYSVTTPTTGGSPLVPRTQAWHHLEISSTPTLSRVAIDGTIVYTGPGGAPFSEIQLEMHAPTWRPDWVSYFDDFVWSPCPTTTGPCGQSNSPCASLVINGVGATGQGPFSVPAPAGGSLNFAWAGPAGQPLILYATSDLVPGQNFGNSVIVDVNLASYLAVLDGTNPLLAPILSMGNSGAGFGIASQVLSVPPSASGGVLYVQGLVFDAAGMCPTNPGLMTTASFAVHF